MYKYVNTMQDKQDSWAFTLDSNEQDGTSTRKYEFEKPMKNIYFSIMSLAVQSARQQAYQLFSEQRKI